MRSFGVRAPFQSQGIQAVPDTTSRRLNCRAGRSLLNVLVAYSSSSLDILLSAQAGKGVAPPAVWTQGLFASSAADSCSSRDVFTSRAWSSSSTSICSSSTKTCSWGALALSSTPVSSRTIKLPDAQLNCSITPMSPARGVREGSVVAAADDDRLARYRSGTSKSSARRPT
eukprot:2454102-Prymnesium_polylepis.1